MLAKSVKNIVVFIFLFAVLERTGVELISFAKWQWGYDTLTELVESSENTTKESEKKEEKSLKEFWLTTGLQTSLKLISVSNSAQSLFINTNISHSFYPPVPTPPPNKMVI